MFSSGFLGVVFNPFYFARSGLYKFMAEFSPRLTGNLLDVGCGSKPYRDLFKVTNYHGLDIDTLFSRSRGVADYFYDGFTFPFEDASYNSVLCNQVLEHVFDPDFFIREINRILQPGGLLLLTVPFVWDEHEQPNDYARYSSFGLHALLERNGFKILSHRKLGDDATTIFQLMNSYLFKVVQRHPKYLVFLYTVTLMFFINFLGIIAGVILPKNPDLYLDNAVLAEKLF